MERAPIFMALAMVLAGCGGNNVASQLVDTPDYEPKDQAKCKVGVSQDKPLIVEWPSGDRADLEAQSRSGGLVVVRYEGCEMKLLSRCKAPGAYGYIPVTTKQDSLVIRNEDELYANMPVGAVKLEGKLATSGQLNVNMTLVGKFAADRFDVPSDTLEGACDGATHVVVGMNVGAFEFFAGGEAEVGGGVKVANAAGAGAKSQSKREVLTRDGDTGACKGASVEDEGPPAGCGASLRIEVAPLAPPTKVAANDKPTDPPPMKLKCPDGTTLVDGMCQPKVSKTCPAGMRFMTGRGCVPEVVQVQAAALPTKGSPSKGPPGAKVVIQMFGGFQDPYSRIASKTMKELMAKHPQDIRLVFRHAPLSFHKMGRAAAYASVEAFAQKGDAGFWQMHDALFAIKKLDEQNIRSAAQSVGLDMGRFDRAMTEETHKKKVDEDFALFNARGFRGTPTFTVGKDVVTGAQKIGKFEDAVQRVLAGKDGQPEPSKTLTIPPYAPTLGPPNAPVTIQWFGSFQEPFTSKVAPTIDKIMKDYAGKVRLVWRFNILPYHDRAKPAGRVALLAHESGRFWDMHRILMNNKGKLEDGDLLTYARQLRLDPNRAKAVLNSPQYDDRFDRDKAAAKLHEARGVPAFFVNGKLLSGARTYADFKQAIDDALR